MHPRTRAKYGAISKLILKLIAAGVATTLTGLSYDPTKTNRTLGGLADYGEDQIRRCLIYLRMQGYVKYSAEDTKAPLIITKKGLGRLNAQTMKEKIIGSAKKRWDHLWRMVVFDIPEKKKNDRDQFREKLRGLGFFPFQKSMYITPFACEKIIWDIARQYHITQYVLVSVTPNLGWRESYAIRWFSNDIKM
jgi:phenylacetic acid degradation operon negative regulatory protein